MNHLWPNNSPKWLSEVYLSRNPWSILYLLAVFPMGGEGLSAPRESQEDPITPQHFYDMIGLGHISMRKPLGFLNFENLWSPSILQVSLLSILVSSNPDWGGHWRPRWLRCVCSTGYLLYGLLLLTIVLGLHFISSVNCTLVLTPSHCFIIFSR